MKHKAGEMVIIPGESTPYQIEVTQTGTDNPYRVNGLWWPESSLQRYKPSLRVKGKAKLYK